MSENECHKGRLIPVNLNEKTIEQFYESICKSRGYTKLTTDKGYEYDSYEELYNEEAGHYYDYIKHDGLLYKVEDTELDAYGFVEGVLENDNSISYFVNFYNGGAGLGEVLEDAIKDAKRK